MISKSAGGSMVKHVQDQGHGLDFPAPEKEVPWDDGHSLISPKPSTAPSLPK